MKLTACIGVAAILASAPSAAADWKIVDDQDTEKPQAIYAQPDNAPSTLLTCRSDGLVSATIAPEGGDFNDVFTKRITYTRTMDATIGTTDGSVTSPARWIPAFNMAQLSTGKAPVRVFNAVVRGESATFQLQGEESLDLKLPGNDDVFRAFALHCQNMRNGDA